MVSLFSIRFRNEFDVSAIWIKREKERVKKGEVELKKKRTDHAMN